MKVITYSLASIIILNLLLVLSFIIGKLFIFREEKNYLAASNYSVYLAFLFIFYFVSIIVFDLVSFSTRYRLYGLFLSVFIFIPFIIGRFANYKRVNFYTDIQILILILSLIAGSFVLSEITFN